MEFFFVGNILYFRNVHTGTEIFYTMASLILTHCLQKDTLQSAWCKTTLLQCFPPSYVLLRKGHFLLVRPLTLKEPIFNKNLIEHELWIISNFGYYFEWSEIRDCFVKNDPQLKSGEIIFGGTLFIIISIFPCSTLLIENSIITHLLLKTLFLIEQNYCSIYKTT